MNRIACAVDAITEDRRAGYLFDTIAAARAVECHPRKFGDWWGRTRSKLIQLYIAQPGELAAEIAALFALAESQRQRQHGPPGAGTRRG